VDLQIIAFAGVAALLTVTPGADMVLVTRNAIYGGMRAGLSTTLGILAGCLAWAVLSAAGLSALLNASAAAFAVLKLAGAVYLILLGLQTIWRTFQGGEPATDNGASGDWAVGSAFRQGLLTNLLNPKVGVFYMTLLPQFVSPGQPVLVTSMLLASIHIVFGLIWLSGYSFIVTKAGDLLRRPRVRRLLERVTGAVLVALGLRVAFVERS